MNNDARLNAEYTRLLTDHVVATASPAAIVASEAAGQATLVRAQSALPRIGTIEPERGETTNPRASWEALGFTFGKTDSLFVATTFAPGWRLEATSHSMHNTLLDPLSRPRASLFYKAAFYDRDAFLSALSRYTLTDVFTLPDSPTVYTWATKPAGTDSPATYAIAALDRQSPSSPPLFTTPFLPSSAHRDRDAAHPLARTRLATRFPDWRNPFAYWTMEG